MPCSAPAATNTAITVDHPLVGHWLASIRGKSTNLYEFRYAMHHLGRLLMVEAAKYIPTQEFDVETPLEMTTEQVIGQNQKVWLCPILRAGLALNDSALEVLPMASVYHLGLYRDETTLKPVTYYENLPEKLPNPLPITFLLDPMLATGGSAIAAIERLESVGLLPKQIIFVCMIASPEGVAAVKTAYPDVMIITASVDRELNENGYILPGLGDAGDRMFGTVD
jgi:uracil phosphoribosyltransferase